MKVDEIQGKDGEWVSATSLLGCCDCGLVHQMDYRLVKPDGTVIELENLWIFTKGKKNILPQRIQGLSLQVKSVRDRELTQKAREEKNFVCSIKSNGGKNGSV